MEMYPPLTRLLTRCGYVHDHKLTFLDCMRICIRSPTFASSNDMIEMNSLNVICNRECIYLPSMALLSSTIPVSEQSWVEGGTTSQLEEVKISIKCRRMQKPES